MIGVTLIIQGFVKNRRTVLMPEESINHIRELIGQRQFKELIEYKKRSDQDRGRALDELAAEAQKHRMGY